MKLSQAAAELVVRAREGDQNAMATIAMVTQKAKEPKPNASVTLAYRMIQDYIKRHPVPGSFGQEPEPSPAPLPLNALDSVNTPETYSEAVDILVCFRFGLNAVIVLLLHGPPLTRKRLATFWPHIPANANAAWFALDEAWKLQASGRDGGMRALCPHIGWELGE